MLTQIALLKAIKYCDSNQRKLAELIGEDPDKISYWLNRAKQIPFHHAIAIEVATNGLVSRYDLAPYAKNRRRHSVDRLPSVPPPLTLSQRGYIGIEWEKKLGNRRGVRSKCTPIKGKTSGIAAKEAGFSSRDAYLRVKKILRQGVPELIKAMDNCALSVSLLAKIAELSPDQQIVLLQKNRKQILMELRKKSSSTIKSRLFKHKQLYAAEKQFRLPLRLALAGLLIYSDNEGHFRWQPEQLKLNILPYDDINMSDVLNALASRGFVIRHQKDSEDYGFITFKEKNLW